MSNKNKVFIFAIFSILLHLSFTEDPVLQISQQLRKWASHQRMEKVHIHFDKPYYAIGDTMWFKAYVVLAETNQLSAVSGILNIEVTSPENNLSRLMKLPINAGTAWGDFTLSDSLPAGTYRVRAFTNWMRNAGEEHFFSKIIEVGDIDKVSSANKKSPKKLSSIADVQFFPEGGELVDGLSSIVAFKAINEDGEGIPVKGIIEDIYKNEISSFASRHAGMGSFKLKPVKGKKYQARIKFEDGSETSVTLPLSNEKGFVMAINQQEDDKIFLKITASESILKENLNKEISIVAHNGSIIYYAAKGIINSPVFNSVISLKNFPPGVARLTLFDEGGRPLNERLVFIRKDDVTKLEANVEKASYGAGEKVKLNIQASDAGTYSVSVVNDQKVPFDENSETSIFSNLLFTSDLKGTIEKPNYYFNNDATKTASDLDLVMLTHGYRRFSWQQIQGDNPEPIKYDAEKSISVSGQVTTFSNKPVNKAKVTIIGPKGNLFLQTQTDPSGRFQFSNMVFRDSINSLIHAETQKGSKDVKIILDKFVIAPEIPKAIIHPEDSGVTAFLTSFLEINKDYYKGLRRNLLLPEVVVRAPKYVQTYTSNLGGKNNYEHIVTYKEIGMMGGQLSTRLNGKLGSWRITNGWPSSPKALGPIGVFVDGVSINREIMTLDDINPDDVLTVELLDGVSAAIYGMTAGGGAVVVTTKRGNEFIDNPNNYIAGTINANITGFQIAREFYSPKYSSETSAKARLANTVFWKPNVITDKSGKAMVEFDAFQAGTYRVVIEGVDINGKLGRKVFLYEVK